MNLTTAKPEARIRLAEIGLALAAIAILVVVAVPLLGVLRSGARADDLIEAIDVVKRSVHRHYRDTDLLAAEHGDVRRLTVDQPYEGWNGPYLPSNLTSLNPWGGAVSLFDNFGAGEPGPWEGGFDLRGDGSRCARGAGQYVSFEGIQEDAARVVDRTLDAGIGGDWARTGRVQWKAGRGALIVFLLDV